MSSIARRENQATLQQLGANIRNEWQRRFRLSADLASCTLQSLTKRKSSPGKLPEHLAAANAVLDAAEASSSCKLSFGLSSPSDASEELAQTDEVTSDGRWSDDRLFFAQLLYDEATLLRDVGEILEGKAVKKLSSGMVATVVQAFV